mgnify:CR=1 FL=1|jgi:hypothetical protein
MNNLFKNIKSIFTKDKNSIITDYDNKIDIVCGTIFKRVRLVNIDNYKYTISIIPTYRNIMIKCQANDNTSIWRYLNLITCFAFSKEELIDYIDKELKSLISQIKIICND